MPARPVIILLMCLSFSSSSVAQKIYYGTTPQIGFSMFMDDMSSAFNSIREGTASRSALQAQIHQARQDYWKIWNEKDDVKEAEAKYVDLLKQKDAYFLYLEWLNLVGGTNGSNSNSGINGLGDAMDEIFGGWATGELDRGISPMARGAFSDWAKLALNPKLQESDEGQKSTQEAYQKYIQKRDLGEFFLRNPYSPLLSVDPKVFLPTWFFLSKANLTIEAAATQVEELTTLIDQQQLVQVADYARSIADWDDFQKPETYNVGNWPLYYSAERVDWKVAQLKPSLVGLYHIKRKYHCTWKQAQQLLQFRINRHGQAKVDSALNILRANLQSKEHPYGGDPLSGIGALGPPQDGLAAYLGKHEIWLDMFDLGQQQMKNKDYKQLILDKLRSEVSTSITTAQAESRYADLIAIVDEQLLLASVAIGEVYTFPSILGYATYHPLASTGQIGTMKNALQFLGALAIATEGDQTFTIALLKDEESGTSWERFEKAIQVFRKLSLDYGEKAVLEAGRQIRSIAAPSWDKLIAANKSYGSSMEDELSIQFRNSLLADGMPEDNYSAQYVQKWEAYQNAPHEHGAEYEGHPLFLERTISIYDDPDLTIRVRNSDLRYPGRSLSLYLIHKVPADQRIVPDQHFMARFEHLILPLMKSLGADLSTYYLYNLTEELVSHIIQNYKISGPNWAYRPLSIFITKKGKQGDWAFETDKMLMSNYMDQTFYDSFFSMLKSQEILKDR